MGNHCVDCKFCGKDQRIHGENCCEENIAQERWKREATANRHKEEDEVIARYGLPYAWDRKLRASDVVAFLKANEGNLKPNLGTKKCE